MLFNSLEYIFLFVPIALAGTFLIASRSRDAALLWLVAASFAFYAWWDWRYVIHLAASGAFNFACSRVIQAAPEERRRLVLATGISANLAALAYFKYAGFLAETVNAAAGLDLPVRAAELPLGISFYTFTQIAFLVDVYRRAAERYPLPLYALFVTFFPHLIAGPLLHHRHIMPQFRDTRSLRPCSETLAVGFTLFVIGLSKKVFLADPLAPRVARIFAAASRGAEVAMLEAWEGALAYTAQLYFDFSGYSDMALGVALMLGIRMPINFDSPYKATSIIDFWRRWHISLSRFLRDYLYVPLGGSRSGGARHFANIMITMVLGGLWHGAGWTFMLWGAFHGALIVGNHAWRRLALPLPGRGSTLGLALSWLMTFLAVVVGWVVFRAPDLATAGRMVGVMFGGGGIVLPLEWQGRFSAEAAVAAAAVGLRFGPLPHFSGVGGLGPVAAALLVAVLAPNSQRIVGWSAFNAESGRLEGPLSAARFGWRPTPAFAVLTGLLFAAAVLSLNRVTVFLYFQF